MNAKLIVAPSLEPEPFLSLGIGILCSQLSKHNIDTQIIDMNISLRLDWPSKDRIHTKLRNITHDRERIFKFLNNSRDNFLKDLTFDMVKPFSFDGTNIFLVALGQLVWDRRDYLLILLVLKYLREKYPNCAIVLGGEHFEIHPIYDRFETIALFSLADYLIRGYGETSLILLLKNIESGEPSLESIPGLVFKKNGTVTKPEKSYAVNLTEPEYSGFEINSYRWPVTKMFLEKYSLPSSDIESALILPVKFSCGCVNQCAFCTSGSGRYKLEFLPPDKIAAQILKLKDKFKSPFFYFNDDLINPSKDYIDKLSDCIMQRNLSIKYSASVQFMQLDYQNLEKMRKSGATRLIFGLETASPKLLKIINKNIDIKHVENILKYCFELGIWAGIDIIAGLPHEDANDIKATMDFLKRNKKYIGEIYCLGFYLVEDSLMYIDPGRFGITNIRPSSEDIFSKNRGRKQALTSYNYIFDEIGGLKWGKKQCQIKESLGQIRSNFKDKMAYSDHEIQERLHILFYLDMVLKNKSPEDKFSVYHNILTEEAKRYSGPRIQKRSWLSVNLLNKK